MSKQCFHLWADSMNSSITLGISCHISQWLLVALSPGSSQFFNGTCRIIWEPGKRNRLSAIACTVRYRTILMTQMAQLHLLVVFLKIYRSNWINYRRLQLLKAFNSILNLKCMNPIMCQNAQDRIVKSDSSSALYTLISKTIQYSINTAFTLQEPGLNLAAYLQ